MAKTNIFQLFFAIGANLTIGLGLQDEGLVHCKFRENTVIITNECLSVKDKANFHHTCTLHVT